MLALGICHFEASCILGLDVVALVLGIIVCKSEALTLLDLQGSVQQDVMQI